MDINPLLDLWLTNIISHPMSSLFALWIISFDSKSFFISKKTQFIYFSFCCLCFWGHIQEIFAKPNNVNFSPMFHPKDFIVPAPTFRSWIHFELTSCAFHGKGQTSPFCMGRSRFPSTTCQTNYFLHGQTPKLCS